MRESEPIVYVIHQEPPRAKPPARQPVSRWPSRLVAGAAAVALHLLFSAPLVLGVAAHKVRPKTQDGMGSVAWESRGEQYETMILLDLSAMSSSNPDESTPDIHSDGILPDEPKLELVSLEPQPPPDLKFDEAEVADEANEAVGDPAGNAAMFGRYMGQVSARIERAWMRPRTPIEGGRFECRARIAQDRQGNVEEIELQNCDSDQAWRNSLVTAIMRASPMSAPPEPKMFAPTVTLNFSGEQYVANETPDYLYEPIAARLALARAPVTLFREDEAMKDAGELQPSVLDGNGDVTLTIIGSEVRWDKDPRDTRKQ